MEQPKIVVTMTSWKQRIHYVAKAIFTFIIDQTTKPDIFYLWLSKEEFPNQEKDLPKILMIVIKTLNVQLKWLDGNEKCFKRWHVYPKHFYDYVFSIDDDCIYPATLIQDGMAQAKKHPNMICNLWWQFNAIPCYQNDIKHTFKYAKEETRLDYWTCGNCLIPPGVFPKDALEKNVVEFAKSNLNGNDEVWIMAYALKHDIQVTCIPKTYIFQTYSSSQEEGIKNVKGEIDENGYSNQHKELYGMMKFAGQLNKFRQLHPGFNDEKYIKSGSKLMSSKIETVQEKTIPENVFFKIVIPNYNNGKYISRCLDSILNQTYQNFFIVVVDDVSTDNSLEILKEYEKNHIDKIKVIASKEKLHCGPARNAGAKYEIDSQYIWFIDPNDYVYGNDALQRLHDIAIEKKMPNCISFDYVNDSSGQISKRNTKNIKDLCNSNMMFLDGTLAAWARIIKSTAQTVPFQDVLFEDMMFFIQNFDLMYNSIQVDDAFYAYVDNSNGMSKTYVGEDGKPKQPYMKLLQETYRQCNTTKNEILKRNLEMRLNWDIVHFKIKIYDIASKKTFTYNGGRLGNQLC